MPKFPPAPFHVEQAAGTRAGYRIVLGFAAYTVGTWGYVLVKGYNITLREWVTPLHPFTGPLDSKGTVPQGSLFPAGKAA